MRDYKAKRRTKAKIKKQYSNLFDLEIGYLSDYKQLSVEKQQAIKAAFVNSLLNFNLKCDELEKEATEYFKLRADQWKNEIIKAYQTIAANNAEQTKEVKQK